MRSVREQAEAYAGTVQGVDAAALEALGDRAPEEVEGVPPGVGLATYRIIQEALTNTLKHASGARSLVAVSYGPNDLEPAAVEPEVRLEVAAKGHPVAADVILVVADHDEVRPVLQPVQAEAQHVPHARRRYPFAGTFAPRLAAPATRHQTRPCNWGG